MNAIVSKVRQFAFPVVYYLVIGYFTYLMVLITIQYIPIRFDVAFLRLKETEIALAYYRLAFFIHVYTSIFVLIAGIPQFSGKIRSKFPSFHRSLGKLYIGLTLLFAAPSGLIMGYHANGGTSSQIAFCTLALLWFLFTYKAYQAAIQGRWEQHQRFMLRSFALTLSAISLRLFKWIIVSAWELPPMDTYRIVAWAGWVVNWCVAELYILASQKR